MDQLKSRCEDLQLRSMNQNIHIHNVQEERGEDKNKLVSDIFVKNLKVPEQLFNSEKHLAGPILIDIAHRIGKPSWKPPPIVVKFALRKVKGNYI